MPISITSNSAATTAQANMAETSRRLDSSIAKISSGQRIFEASEDAAALSIGTGLKIENSALRAASINTQEATSMLQVADGAMGKINDILLKIDTLALQAMSDQISNSERAILDTEYQIMLLEIDRIVANTEFNGTSLLGGANTTQLSTLGTNIDSDDGFVAFDFGPAVTAGDVFEVDYVAATQVMTITNFTTSTAQTLYVDSPQAGMLNEYTFNDLGITITLNSDFDAATNIVHAGANEEFDVVAAAVPVGAVLDFQVGTGTAADDRISISLPVVNTTQLSLSSTSVDLVLNARTAETAIQDAITTINTQRATIGANINRLEVAGANIVTTIENNEIARSGMMDVDVTVELTAVASNQVLMEASISMLAQANTRPQMLLRLLE